MIDADRNLDSGTPDGREPLAQPQWRQDFPIDIPQDNYIARREFIKFLVLTSAAFSVGQLWILFENWRRGSAPSPPAQRVARVDELPVGGSLVFHYPDENEPCLLLRTENAKWVAYGQKCTHLTCAVLPDPEDGRIVCPCHHGFFSVDDGRPLAGPPRRPLSLINLEVRGDEIWATGVELRTA